MFFVCLFWCLFFTLELNHFINKKMFLSHSGSNILLKILFLERQVTGERN